MLRPTLTAALALALAAAPALAHEFIVEPASTTAAEGTAIGFRILSTHVFFAPEEMEAGTSVTAALHTGSGATDIALTENPEAQVLEGSAEIAGGTAWIAAHRLGQVWSKTADGWIEGGRDAVPDAEFTNKYEKFAKALVNGGDAATATAPLGHLLEIVPLSDPAAIEAGEDLPVQVLYDGAPVAVAVSATYAGHSDEPEAYALEAAPEEGENGPVARVAISTPGLWMLRAEHIAAGSEAFDEHVLRSVLMFEIE
ncbi:MAG: DUF4198 domain-containing protein [Pikeienuella sp.]